jgi:Na+-driven multidrug efflux pump
MRARVENGRSQPIEKDESTKSYGEILQLALPVGLETVFQTSFGLIDQIIVGLLGANAVAGVGLANSVSFIVMLVYWNRKWGSDCPGVRA